MAMQWLRNALGQKAPIPPAAEASANVARQDPPLGTVLRPARDSAADDRSELPPPSIPVFAPGERIGNTFEIRRVVGQGAMGRAYLARHEGWDEEVVLKVPRQELLADAEHRHRIAREAKAWTELGLHPHIAYCYYVYPLERIPVVVIEYLAGGNLRDWIAEGKCAELKVGLDLAIQFCHALEHAHARGMVHRDVKPENVLLTQEGTLKLTDFGIARVAGEGAANVLTAAGAGQTVGSIGTYEYMAPEQFGEAHAVDARADIFALGVCLYEMLCGRRPYVLAAGARQESPEPAALRGDEVLPAPLCALIQRCVQWEPERRPASAKEVREELCAIYAQQFDQASLWAELAEVAEAAGGLNNRALSYLALGQEAEAEKAWEAALQADPQHLEASFNQGLHSWRKGRQTDEELVRRMQELCEADPEGWRAKYLLAQVYLERADGKSAKEALEGIVGEAATREEVLKAKRQAEQLPESGTLLQTFEGHTDQVWSVCLSADGRYALSGSADGTLKLWEVTTGRCIRTFTGHTDEVWSVCLSADGRHALSGSNDKTLKLWEVATGQCLRTFEGHSARVTSVCLTADSRHALSGSNDKTLKLWEVATGQCLRTFDGHSAQVTSVCLSADCRYAVSGSADKTLKVWGVIAGDCVRTLQGHTAYVTFVCLRANAQHALSASGDKTLKLWEMATGQCVRTFESDTSFPNSACLTNNERVVSVSGRALRLWDLATGRCVRTFEGIEFLSSSVCLTADEQCALATDGDTLRLISTTLGPSLPAGFAPARGEASAQMLIAQTQYRDALKAARQALARDDLLSACAALRTARGQPGHRRAPEAVQEWSRLYVRIRKKHLRDAWLKRSWVHTFQVRSVCLSVDGHYALSGVVDGTLKLWEVATGQCLRTFHGHTASVLSVCLSGDGCYALSGGADKTLKLWKMATGQCLRTFGGHAERVQSVCVSADGRYALSGSSDKTLKLWEVATGQCLRTFEGHSAEVTSVCRSADGRHALSGSHDKTLKLWEVATSQCLRTFEGQSAQVTSVYLSTDGRYALSGSEDKTLKLWEVATGWCLRTFEGHSAAVGSVCLSADGRYALSGSADKTLKLWEVATGQCLRTFKGHSDCVNAVFLSAEENCLLSGSFDGTVREWFLDWELEASSRVTRPTGPAIPD